MQVLFENNNKGIVSRDNFEWNKNDFSREFKSTKNATDFVEKFQALTSFDRVYQVVFIKEQESVQSQEALDEDRACDQSALDGQEVEKINEERPPPTKKQKMTDTIQMGNIVDSKKVGKSHVSAPRPSIPLPFTSTTLTHFATPSPSICLYLLANDCPYIFSCIIINDI